MITEKEILEILPSGLKLILDKEYETMSAEEAMRSVRNFVKHRYLLGELKKDLDSDPQPSKEDVIEIVEKCFGVVKPFQFKKDSSDCDNASVGLLDWFNGRGKSMAWAILEGHSANLFFNDEKNYEFIEPQTGKIMTTSKRLKITVMP